MNNQAGKILIVLNPISGDRDKTEILDHLVSEIKSDNEYEVYKTTGERDVEKIKKCISRFNPSRILSVGGDGTIKLIAEALKGRKIPIGIIPAGSSNGLATDLGLPLDPDAALKIALGTHTSLVDTLCIENALGLHISDLGINAELIEKYADSKIRGHFGYAVNAIPTLIESDVPYEFTLEVNGENRKVEGVMLAFANSKKFGTGAVVNPTGEINDGKFEVLIFKKLDPIEIFKTLLDAQHLDSDFVETIRTTRAKVKCTKPTSFQIDGEACGKKSEILVEIIPQNIKIIVGPD